MEVVMQEIHRVIKTTTDKVPGELDVVEFLGGLVLSVAYSGGRDWIIVARGDATWELAGGDLQRDDVQAWIAEHLPPDVELSRLVQLDDGTVRILGDAMAERLDPRRRLPFPTGHPQRAARCAMCAPRPAPEIAEWGTDTVEATR